MSSRDLCRNLMLKCPPRDVATFGIEAPREALSRAHTMYLMTYIDEVTGKIVYTLKVRCSQVDGRWLLSWTQPHLRERLAQRTTEAGP
jgi:hypothetical protein